MKALMDKLKNPKVLGTLLALLLGALFAASPMALDIAREVCSNVPAASVDGGVIP